MRQNLDSRAFPLGTRLVQSFPWGLYARSGHRALCPDNVVRAVELAETADTFFSIPARCRVRGRWVSGYVTSSDAYSAGSMGPDLPETTVLFRPHTKFAHLFA